MKIAIQEHGDLILFQLEGEFTIRSKEALERLLQEQINKGNLYFGFDLRKLQEMDYSGLAFLKLMAQFASQNNKKIHLITKENRIKQMLQIAQLDMHILYHHAPETLLQTVEENSLHPSTITQ